MTAMGTLRRLKESPTAIRRNISCLFLKRLMHHLLEMIIEGDIDNINQQIYKIIKSVMREIGFH